jgi:hypothetical protein
VQKLKIPGFIPRFCSYTLLTCTGTSPFKVTLLLLSSSSSSSSSLFMLFVYLFVCFSVVFVFLCSICVVVIALNWHLSCRKKTLINTY